MRTKRGRKGWGNQRLRWRWLVRQGRQGSVSVADGTRNKASQRVRSTGSGLMHVLDGWM